MPLKSKFTLEELEEVLIWRSPEDLGQVQMLIDQAPSRSVVARISPRFAEQVLKVYNTANRPLTNKARERIEDDIRASGYEMTGDTIKFSKKGKLLDGQHRLEACFKSGQDIKSHIVFGLPDEIFDVLDQGRKRTPGDVLAVAGFKYGALLAAAVRWAKAFDLGETPQHLRLTSREILALARGPHKGLQNWLSHGQAINKYWKHAPGMIAAMLYHIGRHDKELAEKFVNDWIHGTKAVGTRGHNFETLQRRLLDLAHEQGGRVNHYVRAAMIVNTFNAWNAGVDATPRDLAWNLKWKFPKLEFDAKTYVEATEARTRISELTKAQKLVYFALETGLPNGKASGTVRKSVKDIASVTDLKPALVKKVLGELQDKGYLGDIEESDGDETSVIEIRKLMPTSQQGAAA